jgi:hypothetical protein
MSTGCNVIDAADNIAAEVAEHQNDYEVNGKGENDRGTVQS